MSIINSKFNRQLFNIDWMKMFSELKRYSINSEQLFLHIEMLFEIFIFCLKNLKKSCFFKKKIYLKSALYEPYIYVTDWDFFVMIRAFKKYSLIKSGKPRVLNLWLVTCSNSRGKNLSCCWPDFNYDKQTFIVCM